MSDGNELLTTEEVAALLRVSKSTVARWAKAGTIKSVRIGTVLRFRRDDLDQLLAGAPS